MPDTAFRSGNVILNMTPILIELIVYWDRCHKHTSKEINTISIIKYFPKGKIRIKR